LPAFVYDFRKGDGFVVISYFAVAAPQGAVFLFLKRKECNDRGKGRKLEWASNSIRVAERGNGGLLFRT